MMKHTSRDISTLHQLETLAHDLAATIRGRDFFVLCLVGDLAAGKTTFTQMFAKQLGVTVPVTSPTYTLERTYALPDTDKLLRHYDLYRLATQDDLYHIGIIDLLAAKKGIFVVEWPEVLLQYLGENVSEDSYVKVIFHVENQKRSIDIESGR